MEELEKQISKNIEELEEMIKIKENKAKIEKQRKKLDELLEKYLSDFK